MRFLRPAYGIISPAAYAPAPSGGGGGGESPTTLATSNGINKSQYVAVSGGDLVATGQAGFVNAPISVRALQARTGKRQFEIVVTGHTTFSPNWIGVDDGTTNFNSGFKRAGKDDSAGVSLKFNEAGGSSIYFGGSAVQTGLSAPDGFSVITCSFDTVDGTVAFYITTSGVTTQFGSTVTDVSLSSWYANVGFEEGATSTCKFVAGQTRTLDSGYLPYDDI